MDYIIRRVAELLLLLNKTSLKGRRIILEAGVGYSPSSYKFLQALTPCLLCDNSGLSFLQRRCDWLFLGQSYCLYPLSTSWLGQNIEKINIIGYFYLVSVSTPLMTVLSISLPFFLKRDISPLQFCASTLYTHGNMDHDNILISIREILNSFELLFSNL